MQAQIENVLGILLTYLISESLLAEMGGCEGFCPVATSVLVLTTPGHSRKSLMCLDMRPGDMLVSRFWGDPSNR